MFPEIIDTRPWRRAIDDSLNWVVRNWGGEFEAAAYPLLMLLNTIERALIANVLKLRGVTADDVMVPRADIIAVPETMSLDALIALIKREGHSRLPVYREGLDDIIGMIHIRDVFVHMDRGAEFRIADILRKPLYVPPSKPVLDLLLEMRQARMHMAVVVDEYGGTDGLVTIEDVVEEIVGEISDELDEAAPELAQGENGEVLMGGGFSIAELNDLYGLKLPDEDYTTVGGFVLGRLGRVAEPGDEVSIRGGTLRVLDMDGRRVARLALLLSDAREPADDEEDGAEEWE